MTPPDRIASLTRLRLEIFLWIAATIGTVGFAQQILFVENPNGWKLAACGCAIAGAPAAIRNTIGGKSG